MVKIYYKRIISGIMKLEDVPMKWRAQVQAMLEVENV